MSQEILSAKFAVLGFGENLSEALDIIQVIIEKSKPLQDGGTFFEWFAFFREIQPEIERLKALYKRITGSPGDETEVDSRLETLLEPVNLATYGKRPVVEAIKFIAQNWESILAILAIL